MTCQCSIADKSFAREGFTLADGNNAFTAVAQDGYGRLDTNSINTHLPASASYSYDLNGNLLSDGRRTFDYDDENQLIRVTVANAWKSEFVYDGKMRRRLRKEFTWQSGNWNLQSEIHYVYDGNRVIQERDASNLPQVSYTRGNDLSGSLEGAGGIGGLLARTDRTAADPHAYYHADGNGNVTMLINASNLLLAWYQYDPYGNILGQSGALADANLYRFSSKEFHPNSGLVYYLYRYYEPNLQRWVNRDPIGEWGGFNMFRFVYNSSVLFVDPHGLAEAGDFGEVYVPNPSWNRCPGNRANCNWSPPPIQIMPRGGLVGAASPIAPDGNCITSLGNIGVLFATEYTDYGPPLGFSVIQLWDALHPPPLPTEDQLWWDLKYKSLPPVGEQWLCPPRPTECQRNDKPLNIWPMKVDTSIPILFAH